MGRYMGIFPFCFLSEEIVREHIEVGCVSARAPGIMTIGILAAHPDATITAYIVVFGTIECAAKSKLVPHYA